MTARFKKHPKWIGKDLTLMVGGGDRKIKDTDTLEGSQWAKFAGLGFLIQVKDSPEPSTPVETVSAVATTEGTTTKSSASKISMGDEKGKGKGKKEKEEPKKEEPKADEVKSETSPVTTESSDAPATGASSDGSEYPSDKLTD